MITPLPAGNQCHQKQSIKKGAGDQTITIQYAGFYPAWWLLLRFVSENCLKLHTTFSDTQLTQRVAYHVNPSTVQHSTMIATRAYFVSMSCLPAKKRLTSELLRFERRPQVDRNIAWGFCPSGTSRMLNARQPQAPNAILYLLILPATFSFKCRNAARKIKTPPSFLTEAFNLSGNIYPSCNPHSLFKPKKRVSSSAMPGSHLRVVWVSPTDKYPSSHNG